jgi:prepilin-type N-terminal cleavage/methylation domain-containing protein
VAAFRRSADDECVTVRPIPPALASRLLRRLRDDRGYTLTELLTAMSIMLIVISTLASVFVSGSNAEVDLSNRFEAQANGRVALDRFRREAHNSCAATVSDVSTVTLYSLDPTSTTTLCSLANTWCVRGSGTRYGVYRKAGATCDATGTRYADYLLSNTVFTWVAPTAGKLPRVGLTMSIDPNPTRTPRNYRLEDSIALRNYLRS